MEQSVYLISEAAKLTEVKEHVLRYWEEELKLPIKRNKMGHRYYTGRDIQTFLSIKELKSKGLQLRAIKEVLPKICPEEFAVPIQTITAKKIAEVEIVEDALGEEEILTIAEQSGTDCAKDAADLERREQFYRILERLLTQILQTNRQEVRCRKLDESIRQHQQIRKEAAATQEKNQKRKIRRYARR